MSHYSKVRTKIKNKSALVKALKKINNGRLANFVEVFDTPQAMNAQYSEERGNSAEILMRKSNLRTYNDVGFAKQADGTYQAIISDIDHRGQYNQQWLDSLTKQYSQEVILDVANQYGWSTQIENTSQYVEINCTGAY